MKIIYGMYENSADGWVPTILRAIFAHETDARRAAHNPRNQMMGGVDAKVRELRVFDSYAEYFECLSKEEQQRHLCAEQEQQLRAEKRK